MNEPLGVFDDPVCDAPDETEDVYDPFSDVDADWGDE